MNFKEELIKIQEYIKKNFDLDFELTTNFENKPSLKRRDKKNNYIAEIYLDICPEWGFAPGKLLLHEEIQYGMSHYDGSYAGASVYKGDTSIDDFLSDTHINASKKYDRQMSIFDYEGV